MTSIDPAKLTAAQRLQSAKVTPVAAASPARAAAETAAQAAHGAQVSAPGIGAGPAAPVDAERVAEIRKAVEQGRYPLIPTRIADAMIAAGHLLRTAR